MLRIATAGTFVEAQQAVLFLLEHGVVARVHWVSPDAEFLRLATKRRGAHEVHIADPAERDLALGLLAEWRALPPVSPGSWEEDAGPDLSRLDPSLEIPCAWCRRDLRGVPAPGGEGLCPGCGRGFVVVERVLARHGPEALEACYPPPGPILDEAVTRALGIPCQRCGHALGGLPARGACPSCGREYDKHATLRAYVLGERA